MTLLALQGSMFPLQPESGLRVIEILFVETDQRKRPSVMLLMALDALRPFHRCVISFSGSDSAVDLLVAC